MDREEATRILEEHLRLARGRSYGEFQRLIKSPENLQVTGASGSMYNVETQAFWDARPDGDLRVIVAVDDGGVSAFVPLSADFIISKSGDFIDE